MVLCAGAFGCYAAQGSLPGAQGQGYDLNLSYSRTTLKAVADAITQQAGIAFSYETALAGYPMENLEVSEKGATIEAILAAVFTPRGIDYRVVDKVVVLTRSTRPVPAASAAAKSEVKGVVRDAAGNPMIGVTVTIKGTLVGVSTGVDGGYAIPADGNATLLFSYIGYRPHEEVVGRRTQIDVTMQEDELVMDEVVVVGYGTLKKRNIVGAVENLSGDAVENRPNANITRSLQGQIPGLNIVQVDGKADHAGEVTIRGVNNTFKARVSGGEKTNKLGQGGGALVLIDGAEGDMGSVNPDDIASISVLKDASSAAVYGARGAFGVILITTKNPEKGKVRVSYNGSVSLHRRTVIWEDNVVTDPVQWVDAFRESYLNSSPTATVPSLFNNYMPYSNAWFEELKRRRADPTMDNYDIDANGNYNYYGETNWLKEIYKSVNYSTTHAVSIQGGREGVSYYISGRYYNQDGIYKVGEETYKKYNLRAKGSIRIRPWLTLDNNTSLMSSKYHQPMVHYGQQVISRQIDMFAFPFALLKNPDGTWTQTAAKTGYAAFAEGTSWQENNKLEVANTTTFNFEFVPDVFKVSADVTYKGSRWSRDRMENLYTYYTGVNVSGQDNSFSSLENWTYRSDYISTNIVGTVTPKLGADHDLNVVAGWNLEDYDYRTQKTYRQGNLYPSKPSFTLMDGEYYSTTSGGYTWGLVGFFGRVNYAYAGRYLAEVSARYDGSSKFPSSSQWGFFPSASVGWRLSEEPWLKPHVEGWLDNFKVRASIGSLGNANIDPYQYLETMTASGSASIAKSSVIINGQNVPYTSVPSLIPDDITWEKVTTYNIGLDLDLFHNRLSFTGDYYRRNTTDLYTVGPNLPQVLGSAAPYGNYASLKTKGWELSLSWRDSFNLGGKPFSYSIKGMLWDSRSWITDYYNETGDLTTYYKGMEIGGDMGFPHGGHLRQQRRRPERPGLQLLQERRDVPRLCRRPALRRRGRRRHHDQGQPHAVQPRRPGDHRQPVAALPVQHQHVAELERHRAFDAVAGRGQARLVPVDGVRILLGQMEPRLQLADEDADGRQRGPDRQEHRQLARHEHGQEPLLDTHGIARRQPQRRPADVGERPLPAGRFVHPTEEHHHRLHLPQAHLQEAAPRGAEGLPVGREPLHPLADVQAHGHVRPRSHHQRRLRFRGLDHFGPERYG